MGNKRKIVYAVLATLFALGIILLFIIEHERNVSMSVVFLDVGQGDAVLISEGSQQLLIDGGKDGKILLEKLGKFIPFWDRNIETIIETHPDQDHIGGLIDVLGAYGVGSVLETKMQSDSQTYKALEEKIRQLADEKVEAKKDVKIKFRGGAIAEILYPLETVTDINGKDTNMYSVVVRLTIGEDKFLFTGDFPTTEDSKLIGENVDLHANFLKVAHHGSKYATSDEFLDAVKPTEAIISVGKNNSYGHPNQETLQRLLARKINVLRTDEVGDIAYECRKNEKCKAL